MAKKNTPRCFEILNNVQNGEEQQLIGKPLRISAADTPLAMIAMRLPLPRAAQKYPVENLKRDTRCGARYGDDTPTSSLAAGGGGEHSPNSVQLQNMMCPLPLLRLLRRNACLDSGYMVYEMTP